MDPNITERRLNELTYVVDQLIELVGENFVPSKEVRAAQRLSRGSDIVDATLNGLRLMIAKDVHSPTARRWTPAPDARVRPEHSGGLREGENDPTDENGVVNALFKGLCTFPPGTPMSSDYCRDCGTLRDVKPLRMKGWNAYLCRGCTVKKALRIGYRAAKERAGAAPSLPPGFPEIVCVCGSTRFAERMNELAAELTLGGAIVMRPEVVTYDRGADPQFVDPETKHKLDELHKRKIDVSSRVIVVNVGGYVGPSTRGEVEYARKVGKPVEFTEPVGSYKIDGEQAYLEQRHPEQYTKGE